MKKTLFTLLICLAPALALASSVFFDGFEFANHDMTSPVGWNCNDGSWLCGHFDKDHNRTAHTGDWYAFTNADDSWMFMESFLSIELRYRFTYWAISDGSYQVEFWAGSGPNPDQMTQLLFTSEVNSGNYEEFSEYIESISADSPFFGIHAIAATGAYHLTIDDINIDMIAKYDLEVTPYEFRDTLNPGEQITIEYDVANTGYLDLHVYMTPYADYFTDVTFTEDGFDYSSFPTVPNQVVHCTCTTTLSPDATPGSLYWMDIMFTVSCDCVTRMATLWVYVPDPTTEIEESENEDNVLQIEVYDLTGKKVDPTNLKAGIYIERTISEKGVTTRKMLKK